MYRILIRKLFPLFVILTIFIGAIFNGPGLIAGIIISIIVYLLLNIFIGRNYNSKDIRGVAHGSILFTDADKLSDKKLFEHIENIFSTELKNNNISAKINVSTLRTGMPIVGKIAPMMLVRNTDFGCKFFDIGIAIEDKVVSFYLFGESKENTKYNMHKMHSSEDFLKGGYKTIFYNPNSAKITKEQIWRDVVLSCFKNTFIK